MIKDCLTCKHDEFMDSYCNDCFYKNNDTPTKWEPAPYYKPDTKADVIRRMSDEQLAEYLVDIGWDCTYCSEHDRLENEPLLRGERCDEQCAKHCLEWLSKIVE